jgi:hypothetical protein
MKKIIRNKEGYIAIVTSVIVTGLVLGIVLLTGHGSFLGAFDSHQGRSYDEARFLAEGCLEYVRLQIAENSSYTGEETILIGSSECNVESVAVQGTSTIIQTTSIASGGISAKLKLTVNTTTLETVSVVEY